MFHGREAQFNGDDSSRWANVLNSGLSHLAIFVQKQAIAGYIRL